MMIFVVLVGAVYAVARWIVLVTGGFVVLVVVVLICLSIEGNMLMNSWCFSCLVLVGYCIFEGSAQRSGALTL